MFFDSPEIRKLEEQDNQFLANGKADWETRILALANDIIYCQKRLYITTSEMRIEYGSEISLEEYIKHYTEQLSNSKECLLHLTDKNRIEKIESLANQIKEWEEREFTKDEKERNDRIIHDNHLVAKAEFLSQLPNCGESTKAIIKEAEGLEYMQPLPHQYPWKHVALSMLRFPDKVTLDYDRCPDCGHSRISIYFYSPECTWAMMYGVDGNMVICPNCKIQAEFNETIRN
ncbi:MAG: hypothetical protein HDS84_09315 [Bacteroidales bacterium]|nr:hypothetical protein [Bacteroidales bacterium]